MPVVAVHNATGNVAVGLGATNPPGRFTVAAPVANGTAVVQMHGPTAGADFHSLVLGYRGPYNQQTIEDFGEAGFVQVEWQGHGYFPLHLQPLGGVIKLGKHAGVLPADFRGPDPDSDQSQSAFGLHMIQQVSNVAVRAVDPNNKDQIMASFEMETTIPAGPGNDVGCGRFSIKQRGRTEADGGGAWVRALEAQAGRYPGAANNRTWGLEVGCHNAHSGGLPHTSVGIYVHTGLKDFIGGAPPKRCNTAILIDGKTTSPGEDGWDRFILCRKGETEAATTKFEVDRFGSITAQGELNNTGDIRGAANILAFNDIEAGNTVTAFQFISTSSSTYKENIVPIDAGEALSFLARLTPVRYNLTTKPDRKLIGFVAEDVPPDLAVNAKGVDVMAVVATLTGVARLHHDAIDQLQARVNQLEQRGSNP